MAVGTQYHSASPCQHFPGILVDDSLMGRYINTAVFPGTGKAKHMIVLIDRATYRTEGIVTVGQDIGHGEFFQPRCPCSLYDSHECNIVACQFIEPYFQLFHITGCIMPLQYAIADCFSGPFLFCHSISRKTPDLFRGCGRILHDAASVYQVSAAVGQTYHRLCLLI